MRRARKSLMERTSHEKEEEMIRPATLADVPTIGALWNEGIVELTSMEQPLSMWYCILTDRLMREGKYFAWVAENGDGEPIGFIDYTLEPNLVRSELYASLRSFYIRPKYRQSRAGYSLWSVFVASVKGQGAKYVEADLCNEKMQQFFQRRGFQPVQKMRREISGEDIEPGLAS
jgi:N-acetylglutamate synthase-like GNAT family acetyltransferase